MAAKYALHLLERISADDWMGIPGDGDRQFRAIVIAIPG
jgi:hypothetical protein